MLLLCIDFHTSMHQGLCVPCRPAAGAPPPPGRPCRRCRPRTSPARSAPRPRSSRRTGCPGHAPARSAEYVSGGSRILQTTLHGCKTSHHFHHSNSWFWNCNEFHQLAQYASSWLHHQSVIIIIMCHAMNTVTSCHSRWQSRCCSTGCTTRLYVPHHPKKTVCFLSLTVAK